MEPKGEGQGATRAGVSEGCVPRLGVHLGPLQKHDVAIVLHPLEECAHLGCIRLTIVKLVGHSGMPKCFGRLLMYSHIWVDRLKLHTKAP